LRRPDILGDMNLLITFWIVIGLAILLIVAIYGGPIIALPLAIAVVAVYLLVRRSRSA
jgi:hypothetical protein